MSPSYRGVKALVDKRPEWLGIINVCHELAGGMTEFAGAWVAKRFGWFPNLRILTRYGILEKIDTSRGGRRAYYRMPDRDGVGMALREFGVSTAL